MPTPRLLVAAPVAAMALGAGLLVAAGGPAHSEDALTPDKVTLLDEAQQVLDAVEDSPVVTALQRQVADRVTALLTPSGDKPVNGVPVSLAVGVIGVTGSPADGYTVVVTQDADVVALVGGLVADLPTGARDLLTVRRSARTAAELRAAWEGVEAQQWEGDADPTAGYGMDLDPELEAVVVDIASDPPATSRLDAQKAPVEGVEPGAVVVRYSGDAGRTARTADTAPHWGGAKISSSGASCTSGFTVRGKTTGNRYSVTAGHCGPNGTVWNSGGYAFGQTAGRSGYPEYDQARIAGSTYSNSIYTDGIDNFDVRTVTGANDGAVGDTVCVSGAVTRSICGITIKSLSATYCDDPSRPATCSTYLMRGRRSDDRVIARKGDSGAPVYQRNVTKSRASIRGMVIAYDMGGSRLYAERYASISNHLNVVAVTS